MLQRLLAFALLVLCTHAAYSQTIEPSTPAEEKEKLQKESVAFLRETMADVSGMRSLENRISFASEMSGLMWFHDEKEARAMFVTVVNDFRQLLMRYDAQFNAFGPAGEEEENAYAGFLGGGSERSKLTRQFASAMGVRQLIAMSIAEHDADLAFSFYFDSVTAISNPDLRQQLESRDTHFEGQLLSQIAETNAAKAAQLGKSTLDKGVTYQTVELLKKIYAKDADKGADFASSVLSSLKSNTSGSTVDHYIFSSLLSFGGEALSASKKPGGKKPAFTEGELRELADLFGQAILSAPNGDGSGGSYADMIGKYAPTRAAQIRARRQSGVKTAGQTYTIVGDAAPPPPMPGSGASAGYGSASSDAAAARAEREKSEQQMMEDVMKVGGKELPKEAREKIVGQARRILMSTPGRDKKIIGLSMLAGQVARSGDTELAREIMKDADALVDPYPKNYQDFIFTLMLASGYAEADPGRAFLILDDTISKANETLAAFIKVGEFIDVNEEIIKDGEVQVGSFGGGMIRGLTGSLGMADGTIRQLVKADFAKTKNLTNRFDRPEIRVLAKMMVLRTILGKKQSVMDANADGTGTIETAVGR